MANNHGLHPITVFTTKSHPIYLVLTFLAVAVKNSVRVRHGMASHHLGSWDLYYVFQSVVLESDTGFGQVRGGENLEIMCEAKNGLSEVKHGF